MVYGGGNCQKKKLLELLKIFISFEYMNRVNASCDPLFTLVKRIGDKGAFGRRKILVGNRGL